MNGRIRKKLKKLKPVSIGGIIYTRKKLDDMYKEQILHMFVIPHLYAAVVNPESDTCVIVKKTNLKRAVKWLIKTRNKKQPKPSFTHLRFARHLKPKEDFVYHGKPISMVSTKKTIAPAYCCVESNKES